MKSYLVGEMQCTVAISEHEETNVTASLLTSSSVVSKGRKGMARTVGEETF